MFRLLSRQAVKAVRRPSLLPSSSTTSHHVHSLQAPHSEPPSYNMIARRFSSSQVDPQAYITCKLQEEKKQGPKEVTSYSNMPQEDANKRLGIRMEELKAISVARMLAEAKYKPAGDGISKTKEKVYGDIVQYLDTKGYPTEGNSDFNEVNVSDLVYAIISPILSSFRRKTGRDVCLWREKEIISVDGETGGKEEFVVVDLVDLAKEQFVLMVERKRSSLGEAMKQCLLAMKDMRDSNGGSEVYGFVTTGESWQMFRYDGTFQMTNKMDVLFHTMDEEKEKWIKDYSVLVDCMCAALSKGGIVEK